MRTMYDGINADASAIARDFPDATMVAGYLDGTFAWSAAEWQMFPRAQHVTIVTSANANAGDVLDVEPGDATAAQTTGWIAMRKAAGLYRPTIYCSLSAVASVRAGTGSFILGKDYDLWIADWDGSTAVPYPAAVAKQYKNTPGYDVSAVFDDGWPHRSAPIPPRPALVSAQLLLKYADGTSRTVNS